MGIDHTWQEHGRPAATCASARCGGRLAAAILPRATHGADLIGRHNLAHRLLVEPEPVLAQQGPRSVFHVMAKPTEAPCNLDCLYCFFVSEKQLYPDIPIVERATPETLELTDAGWDSGERRARPAIDVGAFAPPDESCRALRDAQEGGFQS